MSEPYARLIVARKAAIACCQECEWFWRWPKLNCMPAERANLRLQRTGRIALARGDDELREFIDLMARWDQMVEYAEHLALRAWMAAEAARRTYRLVGRDLLAVTTLEAPGYELGGLYAGTWHECAGLLLSVVAETALATGNCDVWDRSKAGPPKVRRDKGDELRCCMAAATVDVADHLGQWLKIRSGVVVGIHAEFLAAERAIPRDELHSTELVPPPPVVQFSGEASTGGSFATERQEKELTPYLGIETDDAFRMVNGMATS
jgi:hypothetical protein